MPPTALNKHISSYSAITEATPPQWLVVKTKPRAEKKLAQQLQAQGLACYAITYTTLRQWSDRKKRVELPLIPGVVFVEYTNDPIHNLYQYALVQGILKEFGQRALVRAQELDNLLVLARAWSGEAVCMDTDGPALQTGDWVEVTHGQFKGLRGTLTDIKGQHRLVVRLEALQWAVTLDISKSQVKKLNNSAA